MIAREMGADFGYNFSSPMVFKAIADDVPAYAGLRYPHLKDESKPVQVKHEIVGKKDLTNELAALRRKVEAMPDDSCQKLRNAARRTQTAPHDDDDRQNAAVSSARRRQSETGKSAGFAARPV
jgi:hypothetical protein